jgi:hypothetical protein
MKRKLLVALALGVVLVAARLTAGEPTTLKTVTPDWHYRWHEGRWWYWTTDSKWDYWNGSAWIPFESPSSVRNVSAETAVAAKTAEPVYPVGPSCPVDSSNSAGYSRGSGYSVGSGGGYAGYGWSWGPGTAFRDSPGGRF